MVMNIGKAPTFGDAEPKLRCGVGRPAMQRFLKTCCFVHRVFYVLAAALPPCCSVEALAATAPSFAASLPCNRPAADRQACTSPLQCGSPHHAPLQPGLLQPAAAPGGPGLHPVRGLLHAQAYLWKLPALCASGEWVGLRRLLVRRAAACTN